MKNAYFGYPTPVNPDQPMYEPCGKKSIRSSALASLFRYEGRRTRLFSRAEAAIVMKDELKEMQENRGERVVKDLSRE